MSKVNVVVLARLRLAHGYLDTIAAVDPRISVKDATELFAAELEKSGKKGPMVAYFLSEARLTPDRPRPGEHDDLDALLAEAEVIFGVLQFPERLLSRAPKLRWLHLASVGIDRHTSSGILDGNVIVTNSRGALAVDIAEHVLAFIFMLAKGAPRLFESKHDRRWDPFATLELRNRTLGIIGLGAVGSEVARLAGGIGMNVIATRKSAVKRASDTSGVNELYPVAQLPDLLARSDFVVITVPLTAETKGMFGETALRAMKPGAYLINVARGQIVDQTALVKGLKEGWIAGAALDVFETEPLPGDSELWQLPNVVLSYHMAGFADTHSQRIIGLFCENLKRYLAGEPLKNIVDKRREY